jgi:hypothetical protein
MFLIKFGAYHVLVVEHKFMYKPAVIQWFLGKQTFHIYGIPEVLYCKYITDWFSKT